MSAEHFGIPLDNIATMLEAHAEEAARENRRNAAEELRQMAGRCRAIADVAAFLDPSRP